MRFVKNLSTIVVGGLLATFALGEPINAPGHADRDLVARDEALAIRAMTAEQRVQKRVDTCLSAIIKRQAELERRAHHDVEVGGWFYGRDLDSLKTIGLATCFGIAIVGENDAHRPGEKDDQLRIDRYLVHALEGERDPYDEMKILHEHVKPEWNFKNIRVVLVHPAPSSYVDEEGWTDEDRKAVQAELDFYKKDIKDTFGVDAELNSHDYKTSWGISIYPDKRIDAGTHIL